MAVPNGGFRSLQLPSREVREVHSTNPRGGPVKLLTKTLPSRASDGYSKTQTSPSLAMRPAPNVKPLEFRVVERHTKVDPPRLQAYSAASSLNQSTNVASRSHDSSILSDSRLDAETNDGTFGNALAVAPIAHLTEHPERPRSRHRPPFSWSVSQDYETEFEVSGRQRDVVTKIGDFREKDWVIPVGGTLQLMKGGLYRWTLHMAKLCPQRSQIQLGIHGTGHRRPWRLLATSRCSRARDDEPWIDRPGGDRSIEEGDFVHMEIDLRGLHLPFGTFSAAINNEQPQTVFDDIPLNTGVPFIPVVSMGGDQTRVRVCSAF